MDDVLPSLQRGSLGFAVSATREFDFLLALGFRVTEITDTLVRYDGPRRFVRVFHGRSSYEAGVQIGRRVNIEGVDAEQAFPLRSVIKLRSDPSQLGYVGTTARTAELLHRFIHQLAAWTQEFALPLLDDGDELFDRLSALNAAEFNAENDVQRTTMLRRRADEAWRRRNFDVVLQAYEEIDAELSTVELKASERGRLSYARRMLKAAQRSTGGHTASGTNPG
jgi:hypothetical protein